MVRAPGLIPLVLSLLAIPMLAADGPAIRLPADPAAVVLSLDHELGLAPPRKIEGPLLSVTADGTVRAPDRAGGSGVATMRLAKEDLASLLRFVVVEQDLLSWNDAEVDRRIRADDEAEDVPAPLDGATTVIRVALADRSVTVRRYGLEAAAARHPGVAALGRALAVSRRLVRLRNVTIAGGGAAVKRALALANAALAKEDPEAAPLARSDLDHASFRADGGRSIRFRRTRPGPDRHGVSATVIRRAEGEPTASVHRF